MSNLENKNKNILVENLIVFFLFTVFLVFKSLKTKKTVNKKKTIMFSTRIFLFLFSKLLMKVLIQLFFIIICIWAEKFTSVSSHYFSKI